MVEPQIAPSESSGAPRLAVVGTSFGARVHVPAARAAGFDVVALVGQDHARTTRRALIAGVDGAFCSLAAALETHPSVVVVVATPPASHVTLVREALDAGCHVVCEKPFTVNAAEAVDLERSARKSGLICYLGHEFRFAEPQAVVTRLLRDGAIGEPKVATLISHGGLVLDSAGPRPGWWFDEAAGGGWLAAASSHAVDRLLDWFGDVGDVSAHLVVATGRAGSAEDTFTLQFRCRGGVHGMLEGTAASMGPPAALTRIVGTRGTIWIDHDATGGARDMALGRVWLADDAGVRHVQDSTAGLEQVRGVIDHRRHVVPYVRLYRHLSRAMAGRPVAGRPAPATFADGVANMRVLDAIRASSAGSGAWTCPMTEP